MTKNTTNTGSTSEDHREHSTLTEYLERAATERHEHHKHIVVGAFPDIRSYTEPVVWGTFSWTIRKAHLRLVRRGTMVSSGGRISTPGDVVRDYLDYYYPKRLRASGRQAEIFLQHRAAPLLLKPGVLRDGTYVDIHHTYWSIMQIIGWDPDYFPGKWLVPGRIPADFPLADNKAAYACLVSMCLPAKTFEWNGERFIRRTYRNKHLNLGLWTLVQHILHSIAKKAEELGAIYIHTDGYIVPSRAKAELEEYIATWGLPTSVKGSGQTLVLGFGNYSCGDKRTKHLRPILSKPYRNISEEVDRRWLHTLIWKLSFRQR